MIDESRLKAIEAEIPPAIEDPGGDDFALAVNTIHELIATVRWLWEKDSPRTREHNILVQENRQLRDDLVHKDAVIKALQQQYVDHMKPLVALREAVEAYVKGEELDDPRITDEGTALYDLRRALDACRE